MEPAEQGEVGEGVPAAVFAVHEVVDVAAGGGQVTAGEPAVQVPQADGAAQVDGDGVEGAGDVEGEADRGGGGAGQAGAEQGGADGRAGQQGDGLAEEAVPVRGGGGVGRVAWSAGRARWCRRLPSTWPVMTGWMTASQLAAGTTAALPCRRRG